MFQTCLDSHKGPPLHLWRMDVFSAIADKCGGLSRIDENTSSLTDLTWVRFLTVKTDLRLIPRAVRVSDGELNYQVALVVEEDQDENMGSVDRNGQKKVPGRNKWFFDQNTSDKWFFCNQTKPLSLLRFQFEIQN